jgi:hypothetical protein
LKVKLFEKEWSDHHNMIVWRCLLCKKENISHKEGAADLALHHLQIVHKGTGHVLVSLPHNNIFADGGLRVRVDPDRVRGMPSK